MTRMKDLAPIVRSLLRSPTWSVAIQLRRRCGELLPARIKIPLARALSFPENALLAVVEKMVRVNPSPIFILGNQRSGTSAIAALLAKVTGMSVTVDLAKNSRRPAHHKVYQGVLPFSEFVKVNRLAFARDIIKEPSLTVLYDCTVDHFPDAKFVFIVRDPRDNIRSILNHLGIPGSLARLGEKTASNVSAGWKLVIDGRWLGLDGRNYIEMLAARWNLISDVYLEHQDTMVLVRYEDFVGDKVGEISRLARRLGLPRTYDISDEVDIQFQGRGMRNVGWNSFFGARNLARIEDICSRRMRVLGYGIESCGRRRKGHER